MTFDQFERSLAGDTPPVPLSPALKALWFDGRGDWDRAHAVAQEIDDDTGAWVHAYLHRKEGDAGNAAYWYSRANRAVSRQSLSEEWASIVSSLLRDSG
jgi:hypothetical protein